MKATYETVDRLFRGLSVGSYLGRAIKHELSKTSEKTFYDPMSDKIIVSYPMLKQAIERVQGDKLQYSVLRGLFYHELSHAILTPKTLCEMKQWADHHNILNTFEDERIETLLSHYYIDVNFRRNIIIIFNYKGEEAKTPFEAFYNLVRYHKGEQVWLDRLTALICKYKGLTVLTTDYDLLNRYCNDVLAFYKDFTGKWEEQQEQQRQQNNQQSNEQEQNEDNNQSDSNSSSNNSSDEQNEENEDNQGSSSNNSTEDDTEDTEDDTEGSNGSSEEDDTEEDEEGSEGSSNGSDEEDEQNGEEDTENGSDDDIEDENKGSNGSSDDENNTDEEEDGESNSNGEEDGDGDNTASNGGSDDDIEDCEDDEEYDGLDPEVEDAIASVKELNLDELTIENIKNIMKDTIENLFNQYLDPILEARLRKTIDMKLRKEQQRGGAINAYTGRLDPRSVGRKDWRIWLTDADRGCVRQYNTIHLICLIDSSGSMSGNDYLVNVFIRTLDRIAQDYTKFTFDIIQVDEQVIEWKDHNQKYSHRNAWNTLSFEKKQGAGNDLISVIRRHTKPQTNNYIVAMFDGDFHSAPYDTFGHLREDDKASPKDPIRNIDGVNTIIVTDEANRKYIEASCNRARVRYCSNYVAEFQDTVCALLDQVL